MTDITIALIMAVTAGLVIMATARLAVAERDRKEREMKVIDAMMKRIWGSEQRCSECGRLFPNDNELMCKRCGELRRINHA